MATRPNSSTATSDKRDSLTCALCLDIFRAPKLLSCAHTFCQKCLEDVCRRQTTHGWFRCPTCRKDIKLPAKGISAFQNNFYITEKELATARTDTKQMSLFCVECDIVISMDCKLTDHLHHKTHTLLEAAKQAESQLNKDRERLRTTAEDIQKTIRKRKADQEEVDEKKAAIERKIRHRHASVVAQADQCLTEALRSLEDACTVPQNRDTAQTNLEKTNKLREKIDVAIDSGDGCTLVSLAKDMRTVCRDDTKAVHFQPRQRVCRPVHTAEDEDILFGLVKNFIGKSERITYECSELEVDVKEVIQCGEHPDSVVFCVCPQNDHSVWVTFEPSYKDKIPRGKTVSVALNTITNLQNCIGRVSLKRRASGIPAYFAQNLHRRVLVKCRSSEDLFLKSGDLWMNKEAMVFILRSRSNLVSEQHILLFKIHCPTPRAVDVSSTGQLFAVVEDHKRKVRLFRRPSCAIQSAGQCPPAEKPRAERARDIYQSPLTPWRPADVCFFTLSTQEVLLIADELNDAIHVVNIDETDRLTFSRFLSPGCPLLVQPTALNTDMAGRLWVGCRGGRLLTMEPRTAPAADPAENPAEETADHLSH